MPKRIVIIGGVAAGASAAAKARRTSEDVEIILLEAGPYISFANCGLPYYVGGEIPDRDELFVMDPKVFARRFALRVRTETRVESVDAKARTVTLAGTGEHIAYDRLILATGAEPIRPPIAGLDRPNVFALRTVPDADAIAARLAEARHGEGEALAAQRVTAPLRAVVIGGGYIGLEAAEQFRRRGLAVTVIEMAGQLMPGPLDAEMAWPLRGALEKLGCEVILSDAVAEVVDDDGAAAAAVTRSGRRVPFDLAVLAVGVRPSVGLAREAGLKLGPTGAVAVDAMQRTSDPAIYAAGDNSEAEHLVLGRPVNIPLAGPANKAGRVAGANAALDLAGAGQDDPRRLRLRGVLGTAVVRVGDVVAGVTGLTELQARREGVDCRVVYVPGTSHAGYYPGAERLLLKLLYDPATGRLLGAQAVGGAGVDKRLDVLATALAGGLTVEDLEQLDLCYAPPFGSAKDPVVMAGFVAANERRGVMPTITPGELLDALAGGDGPAVIDVRSPGEYDEGHLEPARNVPVDQLRARLDEVPADRPVAVYCGVGYRSYVAQQILANSGRRNVRNVTGGLGTIRQTRAARGGA